MSVDFTRVIPTDAMWVPTAEQAAAATAVMDTITPDRYGELEIRASGRVEFVDAGANWETTLCHLCGTELGARWFADQLSEIWVAESGFGDLSITTPCCGRATSLNDLEHRWPQGFASWCLEVRDANHGALSDDEVRLLTEALGHPIRVVYSHL